MPWSLWYQTANVPSLRRPDVQVVLKIAIINDGRKNYVIAPQLIDQLRKADHTCTLAAFESAWAAGASEEASIYTDSSLLDGLKDNGLIPLTATYIRLFDLGNASIMLRHIGGGVVPSIGEVFYGASRAIGQATLALYELSFMKPPIEACVLQQERDFYYPSHLGIPDGEPKVSVRPQRSLACLFYPLHRLRLLFLLAPSL